jgi:hypothetical protein
VPTNATICSVGGCVCVNSISGSVNLTPNWNGGGTVGCVYANSYFQAVRIG